MTREEKFQIFSCAINALLVKQGQCIGEVGYGDAPYYILGGALEMVAAAMAIDNLGLIDDPQPYCKSDQSLWDYCQPIQQVNPHKA